MLNKKKTPEIERIEQSVLRTDIYSKLLWHTKKHPTEIIYYYISRIPYEL